MSIKSIEWLKGKIRILDQTRLPGEEVYLEFENYREIVQAIKEMRLRGAPLIGIAAAYGLALGAQDIRAESKEEFLAQLNQIAEVFASSRPTAVNLFHALTRMKKIASSGEHVTKIKEALIREARKIHAEEEAAAKQLSELGAGLLENNFTVLTHCNTGSLATVGYGTALGIIKAAKRQGKKIKVIATETRPLLQGARLTTWELLQENIEVTLIIDSAAGYLLSQGKVSCVLVGADRIAANGDVANKIGTYNLAVLATENGVPFYVAAPTSSIDLSLTSGREIPVEERNPEEVTQIKGISLAPKGVKVINPAFDITPHYYVTAIITEKGIIKEPYKFRLRKLLGVTC